MNKGSAALMSPENNKEEFRTNLLSDVCAVSNYLVLCLLDNSANTTKYTSEVTNVETVMEFGWSW